MNALHQRLRQGSFLVWLPPLLYYGLIWTLSSFNLNVNSGIQIPNLDKLIHFCEFFILGALVARTIWWKDYFHHLRKYWWIAGLALVFAAGLTDEIHQYFVPGRDSDPWDWLADCLGGTTGFVFLVKFYQWRFKRGESN